MCKPWPGIVAYSVESVEGCAVRDNVLMLAAMGQRIALPFPGFQRSQVVCQVVRWRKEGQAVKAIVACPLDETTKHVIDRFLMLGYSEATGSLFPLHPSQIKEILHILAHYSLERSFRPSIQEAQDATVSLTEMATGEETPSVVYLLAVAAQFDCR